MEQNDNMTSNSYTYAPQSSDTQDCPDQQISRPRYPLTNSSPHPSMNDAKPTNSSEQISDNITTTNVPATSQIEKLNFTWNSQADVLVLTQHSAGKTIRQIRYQLLIHGCTTSEAEIRECLWKHGIMQFNHIPKQLVSFDSKAEAYILDAHNHGQTLMLIISQLVKAGYRATGVSIVRCLKKQGVIVQLKSPFFDSFDQERMEIEVEEEPKKSYSWNFLADEFALSAYNEGQTTLQIAHQLCKLGYDAPVDLVIASLNKQEINLG